MKMDLVCPNCGRKYRVPSSVSGKAVRCNCGHKFVAEVAGIGGGTVGSDDSEPSVEQGEKGLIPEKRLPVAQPVSPPGQVVKAGESDQAVEEKRKKKLKKLQGYILFAAAIGASDVVRCYSKQTDPLAFRHNPAPVVLFLFLEFCLTFTFVVGMECLWLYVVLPIVQRVRTGQWERTVEPQYGRGVGGWLLLFCVLLTVIRPAAQVASLLSLARDFVSVAPGFTELGQYFAEFPGLVVIIVMDALLSSGLTAFGIFAGVSLWRIRPRAVRTAKRFLLCLLGYTAISAVVTLCISPFIYGYDLRMHAETQTQNAKDTLVGVLYFAIWYWYLNYSKRVKATYASVDAWPELR